MVDFRCAIEPDIAMEGPRQAFRSRSWAGPDLLHGLAIEDLLRGMPRRIDPRWRSPRMKAATG
jgi:hypothetical protein